MKKLSLFMLMAVGLLISGNVGAGPAKVALTKEAKPEMPQVEKPQKAEPQPFMMNPDVDASVQKAPINKAAQNAEEQQVRLQYGSFDQTFTGDRALQDAFDALPANSTPAFVTLLTDVNVPTTKTTVTMAQYHNVTLDLNGHNVYGATNVTGSAAVITNNGTLTIEDKVGGGSISNLETNPEDYEAAGKPYPSYAYNVITNYGTLIINGGYFVNYTSSSSSYVVDNYGNKANLIINGGHIYNFYTNAIRQVIQNEGENIVKINDGLVEGFNAIWQQVYGKAKGLLEVNGGEIKSTAKCYTAGTCRGSTYGIYMSRYNSEGSGLRYIFNEGTINESLYIYADQSLYITGGIFNGERSFLNSNIKLSGGIYTGFDTTEGEDYLGWKYFAQSSYTAEQALQYMQNLGLYVTDYSEYDPSWSPGEAWAVFKSDGTYYTGFYQYEYTKEELESLIANIKIVDYSLYQKYTPGQYWEAVSVIGVHSEYLDFKNDKNEWIVEGYVAISCEEEGFTPETDLIITTVDKKDVPVDAGEKNLNELVEVKDDGTTEITIVPNTTEDQTTIINITENTNINKLKVTNEDEEGNKKGEAQIVVGTGVILNVGNGGIVSENDILTTVLVKDGGTLIIGKDGVERGGEATPIEIKSSEENGSGVLIFSPNAKHEDTKNYAEVDLYTYCKQVGDNKYTWQQFAIPVTGLDNSKVVKTPNKTSYVFEWDYATYSWSQLNNWAQLDEPFAGYDITNVSENGGVVYTFKGDLIGNQNIQLTLPHKDYCVMGNSYTAPIDINALFDQIEKEMKDDVIEKTVYKYNAKSGYYVFTNKLEQDLHKIGIVNAQFTEILPMEGFLLNLQNGDNTAGVMLNYANAVFTPAMDKATNGGNQAPRMNNNTDFIIAKINISSAHATDLVTLVEGDEFSADIENGKDAFKYLNEGANLYAFDGTNKLAMVATDNLEGTMLAFQAAEDAEYTLTFDRALNTEYVLVDMMNGNEVAITEGNTYTFFATPNTLDPARFMVKANAQAPTNMKSTKATKVAKGIYTITGQYLGESNQWNAMPQGVYMVNGIKVIK